MFTRTTAQCRRQYIYNCRLVPAIIAVSSDPTSRRLITGWRCSVLSGRPSAPGRAVQYCPAGRLPRAVLSSTVRPAVCPVRRCPVLSGRPSAPCGAVQYCPAGRLPRAALSSTVRPAVCPGRRCSVLSGRPSAPDGAVQYCPAGRLPRAALSSTVRPAVCPGRRCSVLSGRPSAGCPRPPTDYRRVTRRARGWRMAAPDLLFTSSPT